ncbi:MAG: phosphoenolpyruvate--protein phosphotransferase [Bacillota bacterium]|nr:phosphoenolpyruvate--protein phosphotransferase [Bacillota bacterium]
MTERVLKGLSLSPGEAFGEVLWLDREREEKDQGEVTSGNPLEALALAFSRVEEDLSAKEREAQGAGKELLQAYLEILKDPSFRGAMEEKVREGKSPREAIEGVTGHFKEVFSGLEDPYFRERARDVEELGEKLLLALSGKVSQKERDLSGKVVAARNLLASQVASWKAGEVKAVLWKEGNATAHVAILLQSLGIPAVGGLGEALEGLQEGERVHVEADLGQVTAGVSEKALLEGEKEEKKEGKGKEREEALLRAAAAPSRTRDGKRVEVAANLAHPAEAPRAKELGAEGVGLFRTEFLFMERDRPPSEEEQRAAYREVLEAMAPHRVIFRTLDAGGDKPLSYVEFPQEENPFLGYRGLRVSLKERDLFRTQLRALLRAGKGLSVGIMFPMVVSGEEVLAGRAMVDEVLGELGEERPLRLEVGMMVETPAAALLAEELADHVDFFSIGTNDLTQYTLAVDRGSTWVSSLYDPYHPAVLRLIGMTIEGAHKKGRWVGVCGELAGEVLAAPLLLGLGLDEWSMAPQKIPAVKRALSLWTGDEARALAEEALALDSPEKVRKLLENEARS